MKYSTPLFIFVLLNCITLTALSQVVTQKVDSTRIVYRNSAPIPCPRPDDVVVTTASPLPQYCFYTYLTAVYTVTDSIGVITNHTDYSWYFDDSSNFVAMKMRTTAGPGENKFMLDELNDSIHFNVNLNESRRKPVFYNNRNCEGRYWYYNQQIRQKDQEYKRTGKTRTIHGYLCEEYVFSDEGTQNTFWVTKLNDPWLRKIENDLTHTENSPHLVFSIVGIIIESDIYYKSNHTRVKFKVTEINKDAFYRISSDGYVLNLGY